MKGQDLSYIRMQQQLDSAKLEKIHSSIHFLDENGRSAKRRKHTIFVDSVQEAENFDVAKHFDTEPALADRAFDRPRLATLRQSALTSVGLHATHSNGDNNDGHQLTQQELVQHRKVQRALAKKIQKTRTAAYNEMDARRKRLEAMKRAEAHLITEKLVASKGRKRKIKEAEDGQPAQYKWRRKRQR
jgi:U3 small nucleolar RNA-associated protein 11